MRTLIHVAELGSLSKAADRLHLAQPALSRHVWMMEKELDVRLFARHGRGMTITETGKEVLRHAHRIMGELEEIRSVVADSAPLRGHVSIGMPPTVAENLATPLVADFQRHHPSATVRIVSAYTGYLLDWLHRGEVDLAILFEGRNPRSLRTRSLLEEKLFLIGPKEAGLDEHGPVPFDDLAHYRLLLPSRGHGLRNIIETHAKEQDVQLKIHVEADSYRVLKDLVKSGLGMTILPLMSVRSELRENKLTYATLIEPTPLRRLTMAYPTDRPISRLSKYAGRVLFATTKDLLERGVWSGRLLNTLEH